MEGSTQTLPSLSEIKRALPAEYFESHLGCSLFYVVRSLAFCVLLAWVLWGCGGVDAPLLCAAAYIYVQGTLLWGIFTLGHDCGHGAFSRYPRINWVVGNTLHALVLTPYEPWRLSHRSHHKHTGHTQRDEIFYPSPPRHHPPLTATLGLAWFFYLALSNAPGRRKVWVYATDPLLRREHGLAVSVSFASVGAVLWALMYVAGRVGWRAVLLYYGAPLFVFASWLVVVTFLHHNHPEICWYGDGEWSVVRGALSSVDRNYGWLANHLTHHINLHQLHHLFPRIPHYHLFAATAAFRQAFPHLVRSAGGSNMHAFCVGLWRWANAN